MYTRGWDYPLHLGVTEAGEGEDGRMKSAIGIGALLMDGLGDTIRVSLTEDPEYEMDPCRRCGRGTGAGQGCIGAGSAAPVRSCARRALACVRHAGPQGQASLVPPAPPALNRKP